MKKTTLFVSIAAIAVIAVAGLSVSGHDAFAACTSGAQCVKDGVMGAGDTGGGADLNAIIKNIVNLLLFVIGAVAVIMIVVGGIRYVTSNGESSAVTSAKNTILYAVIGLVVAVMAYAIVNFVIVQFVK